MPEKSALEQELEKLLAGASLAQEGAKDAGKLASKTRRKSRDLEEALNTMQSTSSTITAAMGIVGAEEMTDEKLKEWFETIGARLAHSAQHRSAAPYSTCIRFVYRYGQEQNHRAGGARGVPEEGRQDAYGRGMEVDRHGGHRCHLRGRAPHTRARDS